MKRRTSCLSVAIIALLSVCALLGLAGFALARYAPVPASAAQPIPIAEIRKLALEGGQPLPERLNVLIVGEGRFPGSLVVAGSPWQELPMVISTFQLVYPDQTVVIDAAYTEEMHAQMFGMFGGALYSHEVYDQLQDAMRASSLILLTHEHNDHIGGLAYAADPQAALAKARLTRPQLEYFGSMSGLSEAALAGSTPLEYSGYAQVAPGVVLVEAAGHSPGSQMIYVRLANGAEYLLVGDVLWNAASLEQQSGRPMLISLMLQEDREAVGQQLRALIDLHRAEPDLHLVISHDGPQIEQYIQSRLLGSTFE